MRYLCSFAQLLNPRSFRSHVELIFIITIGFRNLTCGSVSFFVIRGNPAPRRHTQPRIGILSPIRLAFRILTHYIKVFRLLLAIRNLVV